MTRFDPLTLIVSELLNEPSASVIVKLPTLNVAVSVGRRFSNQAMVSLLIDAVRTSKSPSVSTSATKTASKPPLTVEIDCRVKLWLPLF